MRPDRPIRLAIAWHELPAYAARCIRAGASRIGGLTVVATRAQLPLSETEGILKHQVSWVEAADPAATWAGMGLSTPDVFVQGGWSVPAFNRLASQVRSSGGKVVSALDNYWKGTGRQLLAAVLFRTIWHRKFDAFWVPGAASCALLRRWGIARKRIFTGLYAADPSVFVPGRAFDRRGRMFVYVGQFIPRKGLDNLARAVEFLRKAGLHVNVDLFGSGPMQLELQQCSGFRVHSFLQSAVLAPVLADCRFLILPSREDHWGLVVHEATCCGCGLILSDAVGSRYDLLTEENGLVFARESVEKLADAIREAIEVPDSRLRAMQQASLRVSQKFSPAAWAETLERIARIVPAFS